MMNFILKPGTFILNSMSFRGKFILIGTIMFGVAALLTAFLVSHLAGDIQSAMLEKRGMLTIGKVIPMLIEVQKHRGLNSIYLGGDDSALPKLQAVNARQEELIAAIESDGGIQEFAAGKNWDAIRAAWQEVRDKSPKFTRPQSFIEHSKLVAKIRIFVIQLADASGVTLDPMLDTYYLQDTALVKLIALSEAIGQLRAKGAGVLAAKISTPEERAELTMLSGSIASHEQDVRENVVKIGAARPGLDKQLQASTDNISALIAALQQTLKHEVLVETPLLPPATYFAQATATIDAVLDFYKKTDQMLNDILSVRESQLRVRMVIYLSAIASIAGLAVYFFIAMSASVSEAVKEIDSVVDAFSQGDLTRRMQLSRKDELGNIATQFNKAGEHLREIMINVEKSVQSVFSAAEALQAISRQISSDSNRGSESVQATASAIEQTTVSITHVAESSREASHTAASGAKASELGEQAVRQAAAEMNSISSSISQSSSVINGLNQRALQISSIVKVIHEIADQTNLLALNAAIEAARAGEQGRGFAVVADEVRKLAERTGVATGEITTMIKDIQLETASAVTGMETVRSQASRGVKLAEEAAASLLEVKTGSNKTRAKIDEIADAMREQSAATTEIAKNLERVSVMSESTNHEIQGAIVAINQLEAMAQELRNEASQFKV
ncbi:MAG: hypothetical protein HY016_10820 [Nitrosomonadales bacterium]|nr:hypothetical protein [Nitrosomonadales bacterium]